MAKKERCWYYVSCYEEYPIYEPAEGGYYYAGNELVYHYRVGSLKRARRLLKAIIADTPGYYDVSHANVAYHRSRYIGEGASVRIETRLGSHEEGPRPYC